MALRQGSLYGPQHVIRIFEWFVGLNPAYSELLYLCEILSRKKLSERQEDILNDIFYLVSQMVLCTI